MTKTSPSKPHNALIFFQDKEDLQEYLNICIEEYFETGDFKELGKSLELLIKAHGKITEFSKKTQITRQHLYALFKSQKEPKFHTMLKIFHALGLNINISKGYKKAS